jgi:hypothetical protein
MINDTNKILQSCKLNYITLQRLYYTLFNNGVIIIYLQNQNIKLYINYILNYNDITYQRIIYSKN